MRLLRQRPLSCQEVVELVTDYLEGDMAARRHRAVEAHLARCVNCRTYLDQMLATIALTGRLSEQDIDPVALDELVKLFEDWKG